MAPIKCALTSQGLVMRAEDAKESFGARYNKFLNKLTIYTKMKKGPPKVQKMYKVEKRESKGVVIECLHLPRMLAPQLLGSGVIEAPRILLPALDPIAIAFEGELFDNQVAIVEWLIEHIFCEANRATGIASTTLNLKAGWGK